MKTSLKILFLADGIHPFTIGGMQKYSSELVRGLLKAGCEVKLIFSVDHDKPVPDEKAVIETLRIDPDTVSHFSVKGFNFPAPGKMPGHYLKESYGFSKLAFQGMKSDLTGFDFIYAQGFTAWYFLEQKKRGVSMPKIGVNFHGLNMYQRTFGMKAKIIAAMFRKPVMKNLEMADIVFSYGGLFTDIYEKLGVGHKTFYQPIGIEEKRISEDNKDVNQPLKLVFIGRNDKVKGLEIYHEVIAQLPDDKFLFTFIGHIPEGIRLKRKDCNYTGVISDEKMDDILMTSDVLICPSYSEGMPYVILEAMSKGMMIIATRVGAVSEMVDPSNSFLVQPGDAPELKACLLKLASFSPSEIQGFKSHSVMKARRFIWEKIIGDTLIELERRLELN